MTTVPLNTYLKTYRKRAGLSHEEVAFLCGMMSGTSVTRHEAGGRYPVLRTALMYELVLGAPLRELYKGVFHEAAAVIRQRAHGLYQSLEKKSLGAARDQKLKHLQALIEELSEADS